MRGISVLIGWVLMTGSIANSVAQPKSYPAEYNPHWTTQSEDAFGSMPIGNGDIGANVWVTRDGTLHLLLSKTDSHSEIGRLLKIGKLELRTTPVLLDASSFTQTLQLDSGWISIRGRKDGHGIEVRCRVQWDRPVMQVDVRSDIPLTTTVTQHPWRTRSQPITGNARHSGYGVAFREQPFMSETDTILQVPDALAWCHENHSSVWRMTLENQHIPDFANGQKDPLLGRRFGALVAGTGMKSKDPLTLVSASPVRNTRIDITVRNTQDRNLNEWIDAIRSTSRSSLHENDVARISRHVSAWRNFFDRHYIILKHKTEGDTAWRITQGYLLQRYMNACAGRGSLPIKFNGSIFTVELAKDLGNGRKGFDADHRDWGGNFWFQNTRMLYWNMLISGDHDLMQPLFNMYLDALPLARFRTRRYFDHEGAYFPETVTPWGSYLIDNYGWDRAGKPMGVADNKYIRYYWQGGLELCVLVMDWAAYTGKRQIFQERMAPFVSEIIRFYDQHYPRGKDGRLFISPAQSLETYQEGATDPTPEIAGLRHNIDRILQDFGYAFPSGFLDTCRRLSKEIPELPMETIAGETRIAAGRNLGVRANIENPELYTIFPYRLFTLEKPDLELARRTFNTRIEKRVGCWYQDAIQAALLGLGKEAAGMVAQTFLTKHADSRFPAFWGPNNDWVPDMDHGGGGMSALQYMLLHAESDGATLMPAWPADWEVDFKLHLPGKEFVEGKYRKQSGVTLSKKPASINLKIMPAQ
ncbi:MAG: DUF5703 domain-containing protein [Chitinophagaceae bacterium]